MQRTMPVKNTVKAKTHRLPFKFAAFIVVVVLVAGFGTYIYLTNPPPHPKARTPEVKETRTGVGRAEFYFQDRYGTYVQTHLYYPSEWGLNSPPRIGGRNYYDGYPLVVFGEGYKCDNSVYEWVGMNLSARGYVVAIPDFVNNTSPWAETNNGVIAGLKCDTYGGNASLPPDYRGSNEGWPDVWPWAYELIDCANYLVNATLFGYVVSNGNVSFSLAEVIDPNRVAVGGHSTGGTVALVSSSVSKRFAIAFAYAPYDQMPGDIYWPPYPTDFLGYKAATPYLIVVGTLDKVCPPAITSDKIYSQAPLPKEEVKINNGNHMYFCDGEDLLRPGIELPTQIPINPVPISVDEQHSAALNFTLAFLDYHFSPLSSISPYNISEDVDGDGEDEVNVTGEEGAVIFDVEYGIYADTYRFRCHVVPVAIGWGNSTVSARFYVFGVETSFSPMEMRYNHGSYTEENAGWYYMTFRRRGTFTIVIEARSVRGDLFRSEPLNVIMI